MALNLFLKLECGIIVSKKNVIVMIVLALFLFSNIKIYGEERNRMRGIWVTTIFSLDYPDKPTTDSKLLKEQADLIINNCKKMKMTDIFLQVRPSCDAFYKSKYFPCSKYLTGQQGLAPEDNFDVLDYWVKKCHEKKIKLHAWINPFRITKNGDKEFDSLDKNNPAKKHASGEKKWVVKYKKDGNYYFDPAIPEVRKLIINGVIEIVKNYDVDGIHLDDYFYPGKEFEDDESFKKYGQNFVNIDDFRRDNINKLIYELNKRVHEENKKIEFGVSPAGVWANKKTHPEGSNTQAFESYNNLYCDSLYWIKTNMVDYIAPQVYWQIGHKKADYKTVIDWWNEKVKNSKVKLYIGMADYKAALEKDKQNVWYGTDEIKRQLNLNKQYENILGEIHFRYKLINDFDELRNLYVN